MRLFLYGTLLDVRTLAARSGDPRRPRAHPATLQGWRRVGLRGSRYPTLRRRRGDVVCGTLIDVSAHAMGRLAAYEGPRYRLTRVVVQTARRKTFADVWIAPGGMRRVWEE